MVLDALRQLARDDVNSASREIAARVLLVELRRLAKSRRRLGRNGHLTSNLAVSGWAVDDAIQHAALVACTGNTRFRGTDQREAVAWCTRVLTNYLLSELRVHLRERNASSVPERDLETNGHSTERAALTTVPPPQENRCALMSLRERVRRHLMQTRSRRAATSLFDAVCCYLDHVAGVPLDMQVVRWGQHRGIAPGGWLRRARNRVYQYHRRGRAVLLEFERVCAEHGTNGQTAHP